MVRPRVLLFLVLCGAFVSMVLPCPPAGAASPSIFGPAEFVRGTGAPQEFTRTFDDCAPAARFKIIVVNGHPDGSGRVSSAAIRINGKEILGPNDFSQQVGHLERSIALSRQNEIRISLSSKPGSVLTVSVECSSNCPSAPLATSDASSVTFTTASCQVISSIPLINQEVISPQGTSTATHERVNISDDGAHAGVYTITFASDPADGATEAVVTGTFRYFDSSGQLWQIVAPRGTDFFLPIDKSQRLLTSDGSRILMINSNEGNTDPVFTVYDEIGSVLYQSSGTFLELYEAQISPNGRYLLVMGIVKRNGTYGALIRVTDISTKLSSDLPLDIVKGGRPFISISSDGRFLISSQG